MLTISTTLMKLTKLTKLISKSLSEGLTTIKRPKRRMRIRFYIRQRQRAINYRSIVDLTLRRITDTFGRLLVEVHERMRRFARRLEKAYILRSKDLRQDYQK